MHGPMIIKNRVTLKEELRLGSSRIECWKGYLGLRVKK